MNNFQVGEIAELSALLSRYASKKSAGFVARTVFELARLSRRHGKLAETACNRELTKAEILEDERIMAKAIETLERLEINGARLEFGGDPRGYTIKLHLLTKEYNTMGGAESGWGVPQ